jgi:dTDP-4-dehydrorhamnose reductase
MITALIGNTGFVGSNLQAQYDFTEKFNSKNIESIKNKIFSFVVCAGAPAAKWIANQNPEEDLANIQYLIDQIAEIEADEFILVSTIDVYQTPIGVNESTPIDPNLLHPYGKNRYYLENFVAGKFDNHKIIRLPGLFGDGLKKNFLYDMIQTLESEWTHKNSAFQFYNLANLWKDIKIIMANQVKVFNFATEPLTVHEIAEKCFQRDYSYVTPQAAVSYDMHTKYAEMFDRQGEYIYSGNEMIKQIHEYVNRELSKRG